VTIHICGAAGQEDYLILVLEEQDNFVLELGL